MPRENKPKETEQTQPVNESGESVSDDANANVTIPETTEDDIPEDFNPPSPSATNGAHDDDTDDVSSLSGFAIDHEQTAKDREMLSAPTGDYQKVGRSPWQYEHDFITEDKQPGDRSRKGRLYIKFAGPVENDEWKGIMQFRISPDKRFATDFQTKVIDKNRVDGLYRLWLMAEEYYIQKVGESPNTVQDVVSLLAKDDDMILRVVKGREMGSGSFVMGFKLAQ